MSVALFGVRLSLIPNGATNISHLGHYNMCGYTTKITTPLNLIILTTVTLASSNNTLHDDGN
jgi:hypothetical protein